MEDRDISFWEHVAELRKRLIYSTLFIIPAFLLAFMFNDAIVDIISRPVGQLYFFSPTEAFTVRLKVAFLSSLLISIPFIVYQGWKFIEPALYPHEKRVVFWGLFFSLLMFYAGSALSIFIVSPYGIRFLMQFGGNNLQPMIRATEYVDFLLYMTIAFALLFQTPVVMVILARVGILDPYKVSRYRKHIIFALFVAAAIITPSVDAFGMLALALPLVLILEVGLIISKIVYRKRRSSLEDS